MSAYREEPDDRVRQLATRIGAALAPFGFVAKDIGDELEVVRGIEGQDPIARVAGGWVCKTWNTNRGVAVPCRRADPARRALSLGGFDLAPT